MSEAEITSDDFQFISMIGIGNSAEVMLAEHKLSKKLYAIKILQKQRLIKNREEKIVSAEKRALKLATEEKHPFVACLYGTFQNETSLYFLEEYIPGGDLMWNLQKGPFAQERAQFYAAEVCLVLKFLHAKGILYREMKLENIMLDREGHIKVVDFGLSKKDMWHGSTTNTFCGNAEFMAPEILVDEPYGHAVDWWAFGVLIYQMSLRQSPFSGDDEDEIYDGILAGPPVFPINAPETTVDICQNLLTTKPEERLGSGPTDAEEVMNHAYFNGVNWDDLYNRRVPTPYKPIIAHEKDTSNFDPELARNTTFSTETPSSISDAMQEQFNGFSSFSQEL